jgi:hypothetical protein
MLLEKRCWREFCLNHSDAPKTGNAPVEVRAGWEFLGKLHRDEDDGEVVLAGHHEDLPGQPGPETTGRQRSAT